MEKAGEMKPKQICIPRSENELEYPCHVNLPEGIGGTGTTICYNAYKHCEIDNILGIIEI
jgi:carbamoylphosphate synthase large subunit